ncbi:hypothetical protein MNV84_02399 [Leishmania braziliensis]|nr:hypothetical protein MNV84_02399 [Leishmania braziliensis]
MRCSDLSLLVGPHTNHDYLPLSDALLYMPAVLLRETREVVLEAKEGFTKPWRVQDQQREDTLLHLLELRRRKLAAVAQLMAELRQVDNQLLHITETKALDVANWRYQQRGLHRKMEKLLRGATALATCFAPVCSSPTDASAADVDTGKSQGVATACPSGSHTQSVTQKELAQVRRILQVQLAQLEEEKYASAQRLETWHQLLSEVPWGGSASGDFSCAADTTGGEKDSTQHIRPSIATPSAVAAGMIHTPAHNPPPQPRSHHPERWHASEVAATSAPCTSTPGAPLHEQQQTPSLPSSPETDIAVTNRRSPHPSDAEVVLLQHALHNINGALRQRLLHAAAASLSSSSSQSPPTSHYAFAREAAAAADVNISGLPPLPDATPLRGSTSSNVLSPCPQQNPTHPGSVSVTAAAYVIQPAREQQQETSLLPRCAEATVPVTLEEGAAAAAAFHATEEVQRRVWRQSLQVREQEMKDSLNQLLYGTKTTSSSPSRERGSVGSLDDAGRPAASAMCSSIPTYQRSLESQ